MANVVLARPQANVQRVIPSEAQAKYELQFDTGEAVPSRDGDDLRFTFDDGGAAIIENYYTTHGEEDMPSFVVGDQEFTAVALAEALEAPDLNPAAGPAAGQTEAANNRYHAYDDAALAGGIDHLGALDYNTDRGFEFEPADWITAPDEDGGPLTVNALLSESPFNPDAPVRPEPVPPVYERPDTPDYPPTNNIVTPIPPARPVQPEQPERSDPPYEPSRPSRPQDIPTIDNKPRPEDPTPDKPGNTPDQPDTPPDRPGPDTPPEKPGPGNPPDNPGPDNPPVNPPKDPEDPKHPDNPDNPSAGNFIPASGNSHVVVDEGAWLRNEHPDQTPPAGNHTVHGFEGSYHFNVRIPVDEGGQITLAGKDEAGNDVTLTYVIPANGGEAGKFEPMGDSSDTFYVGGVRIGNFQIEPVDGHPDQWHVTYDYELTKIQEHGRPGTETDDMLLHDNEIKINVTDGSGDEANSHLTVEIHDDVPYIYAQEEDNGDGTVRNNSAVYDFGADDEANNLPFESVQKIEIEVETPGGEKITAEIDPENPGQIIAGPDGKPVVTVTVDKENGKITVDYPDKSDPNNPEIPIKLTITDADGDPDTTELVLEPPKISNPPYDPEKPDPDNPDKPGPNDKPEGELPKPPADDPNTGEAHVVVDEAALDGGKDGHVVHGASGSTWFIVNIPEAEGGKIELKGAGADGKDITLNATVAADGSIAANFAADAFRSSGVDLYNFKVVETDEPGKWKVEYDYKLTGNQTHNKDIDKLESFDRDGSSDDVNFGFGAVQIKVTDGTGDTAESQINVEIHDDVPVISDVEFAPLSEAEKEKLGNSDKLSDRDEAAPTLSGSFKVDFGADNDAGKTELKIGDETLEFVSGQATVTVPEGALTITDNGNGNYSYSFAPAAGQEGLTFSKDFKITAVDSDRDTDVEDITVRLDYRPELPSETPKDPEDPGKPDDEAHQPAGSTVHVVMDEGALADGGSGDHAAHKASGESSFTAHFNGGETGTIEVGGYKITIGADGKPAYSGKDTITSEGGAFTMKITGAEDKGNGDWQVNFEYTLNKNVEHGDPTKSGSEDYRLGQDIDILVTDTTGDTASGKITYEIHDDRPEISAVDPAPLTAEQKKEFEDLSDTHNMSISGTFNVDYGADDDAGKTQLRIDDRVLEFKNGKAEVVVNKGEATEGTLTITEGKDGSYSYSFDPVNKNLTFETSFNITAIDSDRDTDVETIKVNLDYKPEIPTDPKPEVPDPENPDGPKIPDPQDHRPEGSAVHVIMDEGALADGGSDDHAAHKASGESSFTAHFNGGETGTIEVGGYKITIGADGKPAYSGKDTITSEDGAFTMKITGAEDKGNGDWQVNFEYMLNKNVEHGDPTKSGSEDYRLGQDIDILVTDTTGDTASGKITYEIHDDRPEISAVDPAPLTAEQKKEFEDLSDTHNMSISGTFNVDYGADDDAGKIELQVEGNKIPFDPASKSGSVVIDEGKPTQGTLTVTQKPDGSYEYSFDPVNKNLTFETSFNITAIDSDRDTDVETIKVNLDYRPELPSETPKDPEDPGKPDDEAHQPAGSTVHVVMDEGALADGGSGDHAAHKASGKSSFTARFNGGEDGSILIGEGANACKIVVTKDKDTGKFTSKLQKVELDGEGNIVNDENGNPIFGDTTENVTVSTANNVTIAITGATQVGDTGDWTVNFSYALGDNVVHGDAEASGAADSLAGVAIPIKVTDHTGDTASGKITYEIHDDRPEIGVVADSGKPTNTVEFKFGADDDRRGDLAEGSENTTLKVYHKDADGNAQANAISWAVAEGKTSEDISKMESGHIWTAKDGESTITVTRKDDGKFEFSVSTKDDAGYNSDLFLKVTDSDGDVATTTLKFTKPEITPTPDPENPDDPKNKEDLQGADDRVVLDEGDRPQMAGDHDHQNIQQFNVNLNGEGGKIIVGDENDVHYEIEITRTPAAEGVEGARDTFDHTVKLMNGEREDQYVSGVTDGASGITIKNPSLVQNDDGSWTVNYETEKSVMDHDKTAGSDEKLEGSVNLKVYDESGDSATGSIKLELHDDAPTIQVNDGLQFESHGYTIDGTGSFDFGADQWANGSKTLSLTFTKGENQQSNIVGTWAPDTGKYEFTLDGGTLELTPQAENSGAFNFTYTSNNALNTGNSDLDYKFQFKVTDADGDEKDSSASCVVPPTQIDLIRDPDKPTDEIPETEPKPFDPGTRPDNAIEPGGDPISDVDNIIIGSTTEYVLPNITHNMVFLYDLAGKSSSIYQNDATYESLELKPDEAIKKAAEISDETQHLELTGRAFVGSDGKHYFEGGSKGGDKKYYCYEELYQSMNQTIEYVKGAYADIQAGSTLNVLMGGFDIKIEAGAQFTITCDESGKKSISVMNFASESPTLKSDHTLGNPTHSTGYVNKDSQYSQPFSPPENVNVDTWLDAVFAGFQNSVIYNLNTAFSEGDCGYTYTTTNIDNALGMATGWLTQKQTEAENKGMTVVNKTFLLGDGGGTAHTEPIPTGSHAYFNNWQGGAGPKFNYDVHNIQDIWVGDATNGGWASAKKPEGMDLNNLSWKDVGWEYGKFAVVKVAGKEGGEPGETDSAYLVINQLGLVCGTTSIDSPTNTASQLKYLAGATVSTTEAENKETFKEAVPVVMDWVTDKDGNRYFAPQLSHGTLNHFEPSATDTRNNQDEPSEAAGLATADILKKISELTVIQFGGGDNKGADLDGYASLNGAGQPDTIIVKDWSYLPSEIKAHMPKVVDDIANGNKGDDIIFGDNLASTEDMSDRTSSTGEDGKTKYELKYNAEKAQKANVDNLREIAAKIDPEHAGEGATAADIAAVIWNNSDKVAELLDARGPVGGNDILAGGGDNDLLFGMAGNDVLLGDGNMDTIESLARIIGEIYDKPVNLKASAIGGALAEMTPDQLESLVKRLDELEGEKPGNDRLYGGNGDDVLLGMEGDDQLYGGAGKDFLFGGSGDDFLDGGAGADVIFGGEGNDIIVYDKADKIVDGGEGINIVIATGKDAPKSLADMLKAKDAAEQDARPTVTNIQMLLKPTNAEDISVNSMASLAALGIVISNDRVFLDQTVWDKTPENTDVSNIYASTNKGLELEIDKDTSEKVEMTQMGTVGNDIAKLDEAGALHGLAGNDILTGSDGNDRLYGGEGADTLHGGKGDDYLAGGEGADTIYGGDGRDIILIDKDDVFVDGGAGIDIMLSADGNLSLKDMLNQGQKGEINPDAEVPAVVGVEVLVKGPGVESVTSLKELAEKFEIDVKDDNTLTLGAGWKPASGTYQEDDSSFETSVFQYGEGDDAITLETTLVRPPHDPSTAENTETANPDATVVDKTDGDETIPDGEDQEENSGENMAEGEENVETDGKEDAGESGDNVAAGETAPPADAPETDGATAPADDVLQTGGAPNEAGDQILSAEKPEDKLDEPLAGEDGGEKPEGGEETAAGEATGGETITLVTPAEASRLEAEYEARNPAPETAPDPVAEVTAALETCAPTAPVETQDAAESAATEQIVQHS